MVNFSCKCALCLEPILSQCVPTDLCHSRIPVVSKVGAKGIGGQLPFAVEFREGNIFFCFPLVFNSENQKTPLSVRELLLLALIIYGKLCITQPQVVITAHGLFVKKALHADVTTTRIKNSMKME